MIEKLKEKTNRSYELNTGDMMAPTNWELASKINEIIDVVNSSSKHKKDKNKK
jgi:hypothetical protein